MFSTARYKKLYNSELLKEHVLVAALLYFLLISLPTLICSPKSKIRHPKK